MIVDESTPKSQAPLRRRWLWCAVPLIACVPIVTETFAPRLFRHCVFRCAVVNMLEESGLKKSKSQTAQHADPSRRQSDETH